MIKLIALTLTFAAISLTASIAGTCDGSGCTKGGDKEKEPAKEPAMSEFSF